MAAEGVSVLVVPEVVYIEKGRNLQYLNFDFHLQNETGTDLELCTIKVYIHDSKKQLVTRKFISRNGSPGSIYTVPKLRLDSGKTLCVFNPFYFFDIEFDIGSLGFEFVFESMKDKRIYKVTGMIRPVYYKTKTQLILPLKQRVFVFDGHDFYAHHRRIDLTNPEMQLLGITSNPDRYAYDFCVVNKKGEMFSGEGDHNEDWFGFGVPVFSPGKGKVVDLVNDTEDNIMGKKMFDFDSSAENPMAMAGNYVIISHLNGEYSLLGHLKKGSIKVHRGDKVRQGQAIGQMGFSGATANWVHVHYGLCNEPRYMKSEGLPSYFSNFRRIIGSKVINVRKGQIDTGDIIEGKI